MLKVHEMRLKSTIGGNPIQSSVNAPVTGSVTPLVVVVNVIA
jgi:hypothetical protein